jgi:uracil-DNA glycosylase family 4
MIVEGEGPLPCDWLILAEAPGEHEDALGRPMVGPAGELLNKLLPMAGLRRSEVHIDNVVQERPPGNKTPSPKEIREALPDLHERLRRVGPKTIIACGRVALSALGVSGKLTTLHGQRLLWSLPPATARMDGWDDYALDGLRCTVVPMYHPAAALHDKALAPAMIADWRRLAIPATPILGLYRVATDKEAADYVQGSTFAFDLETTSPTVGGRFAPSEARILGYSVAGVEGEGLWVPEMPAAILPRLSDSAQVVVCHNAKFEAEVLWQNTGVPLRQFQDTQLMAYVLGYKNTSLKGLANQVLGVRMMTMDELLVGRETEDLTAEEWLPYAPVDADMTLRLFHTFQRVLHDPA